MEWSMALFSKAIDVGHFKYPKWSLSDSPSALYIPEFIYLSCGMNP
jgi:hypothetical protein